MTLDPQAQEILDMAEQSDRPLLETLGPVEAREQYAEMVAAVAGEIPEGVETKELTVGGAAGPLAARDYRPVGSLGPLPCLVYFHGGGFVIGDRDTHDIPCRHLALGGRCSVISVDYRLAPEHPFPAPVEDAWAATRWIVDRASDLDVDATRIAVGGDSAGGNQAASVSHLAREAGAPALACQLLIYPATDLAGGSPSYTRLGEGYRLTKSLMGWFMDHYFTEDDDRTQILASPLRAADFAGLPPAIVLVAGYDPLVDEGVAYAEALRNAGVETQLLNYQGMIHGFINMGRVIDAAAEAMQRCGTALRAVFDAVDGST